MRLIAFSVVVACAWFLITSVLSSAVVWLLTPLVASRAASLEAPVRAATLFAWRMLPATVSLVASVGVAWPAFIVHESRRAGEPVTWWLALGMVAVAALVAAGMRALGLAWRAVRERTSQWKASAHAGARRALVVDDGLATAAVAGVWRPTVFVGRALADTLTPGELRAVVAHEWAHAWARDNVKRALLLAAPDPLRFTRRGAALVASWLVATEHAADDRVARLGRNVALDLAGALVKAARVVGTSTPAPALARGVAEHGDLVERVVRLVASVDATGRHPDVMPRMLACAMGALIALPVLIGPALSPAVHAVSEILVNGRF